MSHESVTKRVKNLEVNLFTTYTFRNFTLNQIKKK